MAAAFRRAPATLCRVRVAGVDGVGPLWVAAVTVREPGGTTARAGEPAGLPPVASLSWLVGSAADVLDLARSCDAVAVDVPIGFVPTGTRACEGEARRLLGRDRSSVFVTPPQPAWEAAREFGTGRGARAVAQEASRAAGGPGIPAQSWGLAAKVLEVEAALRALPAAAARRVVETHPETAFRVMPHPTDGTAGEAWPSKRSAAGVGRRLLALEAQPGWLVDPALLRVPVDDALDALAAAWTAARVATGRAVTLGAADGARAVWSDGRRAPGRSVLVV